MSLPHLDLSAWEPTRLHWQLLCQMIGKVRLKTHPPMNHWWHVPLYVSPRGLSTGEIPYEENGFDIEHDVLDHRWVIRRGRQMKEIDLPGKSIAESYAELQRSLAELDIHAQILAKPFDCKSKVPFVDDTRRDYDAAAIENAWSALLPVDRWFKEFRGEFIGKCSPVHMFWHSFDLAVTRFSGRPAPAFEADRVTMNAYSHEVISAGFWFGDDVTPEAAFYCYAAPSPAGIDQRPLSEGAKWIELRGSPMAILPYETVRTSDDPETLVRAFLESTYAAGAGLAEWSDDLVAR